MSRSTSQPEMAYNDEKVFVSEIDEDQNYNIINPSVGTAYFGTVNVTGDGAGSIVWDQKTADYPRAIRFDVLGVAGGMGGTAVINGKDQFNNTIQESIGFATAAGGGTANGTLVFAKITSGTVTIAGLGGTAVGSAHIGVNIAGTPIFGLPMKAASTADIKRATWIDSDVAKMLNVNSVGTSVTGIASQTVLGRQGVTIDVAGGIAAADSFVITYRSSFKAEANQFKT